MENHLLLQRYRRDRRNLLDFILSSGLAGDVRPPPRDVDLDTLSVDYVVDRVKSGKLFRPLSYFVQMNSLPRNSYFLISRPESSGSPPQRVPPSVPVKKMNSSHFLSEFKEVDPFASFGGSQQISGCAPSTSPQGATDEYVPSWGLPPLKTDLSDDDIRETAYEVLLACVVFSISEVMDACMKQSLCQIHGRILQNQLDIPSISLELMGSIGRSDFLSEKSYLQWQKRQANILEELLCCTSILSMDEQTEDFSEEINHLKYVETLIIIRRFASRLSVMPGKFGVLGETYYWTSGYHLNIKLYKSLLCCIFDILEECQIIEEADEVLRLLKLTWTTLGINQTLHDALFGWVLFQQFLKTGEAVLLEYAVREMQKVVCSKVVDGNEAAYMNSLICSIGDNDYEGCLSLIHAVFLSVNSWCNQQLEDYHLHFSQFVDKSIRAAFKRVMDSLKTRSKEEMKHPLAVLAEELKLISDKEHTVFSPVLREWCPEAGTLSAVIIHQLYGAHLKPFLDGVLHLSEDVRTVLPAADSLEHNLIHMICFASGEDLSNMPIIKDLHPYQVGEVAGPVLLEWVNAQHQIFLEWTERAISIEVWEPLSSQQRQAPSIIEIFRIFEEAIDQFFDMNLPVDITQLQSLLSGIVKSLEVYLLRAGGRLVSKDKLYPSTPTLTRYKETRNVFVKKRFTECASLEARVEDQLRELTAFKLCVRLNTLHFFNKHVNCTLIFLKYQFDFSHTVNDQSFVTLREEPMLGELLGELFTIFDGIRRSANDTIESICDFIGVRVVFVDLRDSFLFSLYRGGVENARLDSRIQELDMVLDQICAIIVDTLRDPVALSICRASMEGYVWALLNGGPSRAFSNSDFPMMQEDLYALKEFFIADGQGLPSEVVEQETKLSQWILDLYTIESETLIEMLMRASEQISFNTDLKRSRFVDDADTLLRILCHKKDKDASKFLKRHYQLPKSSDYEDMPGKDSNLKSPLITDLLKRGSSFHWAEKSQRSFRTIKKKLQEATSEIKNEFGEVKLF
ncbi:hypothetical protein QJS04_geneDACA022258 [Acorus gramineus]|uniref:Protein unc-13 homolog n=1 Tax=Acorus gramineus TaxID=55184 RepID=A0AAV9BE82_ACOGR|nr:hypothetical protein QJS04_geneDACA022258 [Acorus gramineus]